MKELATGSRKIIIVKGQRMTEAQLPLIELRRGNGTRPTLPPECAGRVSRTPAIGLEYPRPLPESEGHSVGLQSTPVTLKSELALQIP